MPRLKKIWPTTIKRPPKDEGQTFLPKTFSKICRMHFRDILKKMTLGDKILILLLGLVTGASFPLLSAYSKPGEWGVIEVNGEFVQRVPLREDREYATQGYEYATTIGVKDGGIEIQDILCPNPLLHAGRISRTGEVRVCVHNRTVIRIEGGDSLGVDVISK